MNLVEQANLEHRRISALMLGFSAAALAFAIHHTSGWSFDTPLFVAAVAGLIWGLGFVAGIGWANAQVLSIKYNAAMERMGDHHPRYAEISTKFDGAGRKAAFRYRVQHWSLISGALVFVVAHGMHVHSLTA